MSLVEETGGKRLVAYVRFVLGVLFVMTGAMKIVVPALAEAWSGQLLAAGLPLYEVSRWSVPFVEIALGALLLSGRLVRLASLAVIGIMLVATYVHLTVDDPSLFPLQPNEPIVPLMVMAMAAYVLWKGTA